MDSEALPQGFEENAFYEVLKAPIYDLVKKTPLSLAGRLSAELGNQIYFKREDLQSIYSFKIRGAYNKIKSLYIDGFRKGVICVSAGNHGQGVAIAAQKLGLPAKVVMPVTTPTIKIEAVRSFGAEVILHGDSYSDAADYCQKFLLNDGFEFIHPFDDPLVIAGQGTIGKEIVEALPNLDYVFVPVGGGGLIAGIALYIKKLYPHIQIVGVEPIDSAAMYDSINRGDRVTLKDTGTFADGVAVKRVGDLTFKLAKKHVDHWIKVSNDEICSAIESAHRDTRAILEPAGALAIAGVKNFIKERGISNKTFAAINSGANINFSRMQFVAERVRIGNEQESLYAVQLKERAGELQKFCSGIVGNRNITEFNYRRGDNQDAYIFVGIETLGKKEKLAFETALNENQYNFHDLTDNELAKEHIRYMVGGICHLEEECIFRFEFPERPEALANFLAILGCRWSISLFHYRSHGADFGRVLIGLLVPQDERQELSKFLETVRYPNTCQNENTVVRTFLNPSIGHC